MREFDLLVIGSGPAGQKAAIQAAKLRKRVAVIEKERVLGGSCINTGTLPSKTLKDAIYYLHGFKLRSFTNITYSLKKNMTLRDLMARKDLVIRHELEVITDQLERNDVEIIHGTASFFDAHTLKVSAKSSDEELLTAPFIVIATGPPRARPGGNHDERRSEKFLVCALGGHFQGVRVEERGRAVDDLHVVALELVGDDLQLVPDNQVLPVHQVPERHILFQGVRDVGEGAELEPMQVVDGVLEGLARQRAGVDAGATEHPLLLDDGHPLAQLGCLDGGLLAGGAAADHQQVEFTHRALIASAH